MTAGEINEIKPAVPLENFDPADVRLPSARDEARALFGLVERGSSTVEAVRELVAVPPADVQRLCRIVEQPH